MFCLFPLNSLLTMNNRFAAAEIDMQKKRRAKKVDLVDEIYYKKAQFAEEARLKRQELDQLKGNTTKVNCFSFGLVYMLILRLCSDDLDEESDIDLFVSQEAKTSRKRSHAMTMEDERGDSLEDINGESIR